MINKQKYVKISFPSSEAYYATYQRDVAYYEAAMQILLENPGLMQKRVIAPSAESLKNENQEMYCTLFCETSDKTPLRNYYQFVFQVGQIFGPQLTYEETENGFLLFFKTQLDFDIGLVDVSKFR